MNIEKVTIKKINHTGFGLCHLVSGKILPVRGGLPGEIAEVTLDPKKQHPHYGKIKHLIEPHSRRRTAPCRYYNQCGGCNLQHCDTSTQLTIKKEILHDLLYHSPEVRLREAAELLPDPVASPVSFGYRQRIRLRVDDQGRLGFRKFRSHVIVPVTSCMLAEEPVNRALEELGYLTDFYKLTAIATEVELQLNPASQTVVCLVHLNRKPRPADIAAARSLCNDTASIDRVFFSGENFPVMGPYGKQKQQKDRHLRICYNAADFESSPLHLQWEAGGFCQVNLRQNSQLISIVLEFCRVTEDETVLDLFCGMGNFSIPLGRIAKTVTGVEGQGSSIRSAKYNAQHAGLTNATFFKSPITAACESLLRQETTFDCVVIDPPRHGVPYLASALEKLTNKRLVYISCDPATLCRDLASLSRAGFILKKILPLDMFPQTHHVETVVLLEKHKPI